MLILCFVKRNYIGNDILLEENNRIVKSKECVLQIKVYIYAHNFNL